MCKKQQRQQQQQQLEEIHIQYKKTSVNKENWSGPPVKKKAVSFTNSNCMASNSTSITKAHMQEAGQIKCYCRYFIPFSKELCNVVHEAFLVWPHRLFRRKIFLNVYFWQIFRINYIIIIIITSFCN